MVDRIRPTSAVFDIENSTPWSELDEQIGQTCTISHGESENRSPNCPRRLAERALVQDVYQIVDGNGHDEGCQKRGRQEGDNPLLTAPLTTPSVLVRLESIYLRPVGTRNARTPCTMISRSA